MAHTGNKNFFRKLISPLLDLIFPKMCLGCKKEGSFLCEKCLKAMEVAVGQSCVVCNKQATISNQLCEVCQDNFCFDTVFVMSTYDGVIKQIIGDLKFNYVEEVADRLAEMYAQAVDMARLGGKMNGQLLIAIPLHKKRFLERGFNQSELIAQQFGKYYNMNINNKCLQRIRNTKQQANLNKEERLENMKDAFCAKFDQVPHIVYLFDDVFTTGQTMNEAAKALKKAGVKEVNVLALAHGN